ncbi:DUF6668 family protein [Rhodococcus sp. NPDC056960]|uniref:DUF6668 family protein n=1 Tax=Rhodococcus sp. NPDC056960 TaxID=3345982 RepID=UPI003638ADA7
MSIALPVDDFDDLPRRPRIVGAQLPPRGRCAPIWNGPVHAGEFSPPSPMVWLLGATGGAGVSVLTRSLAYAGDCGRSWPSHVGPEAQSPLVIIVARTTMHGLTCAHDLLLQHAAGGTPQGVDVLGAITVADSDRPLSKPVRHHIGLITSLAGACWDVPWIEPWRVMRHNELPAWGPGSTIPATKRDRSDHRKVPPAPVIDLYDRIRAAARERITTLI